MMSMAHGLEIRVPLIDHRLTEKMFAIPGGLKLKKGIPKTLLVGAIQEQLPHEIGDRKFATTSGNILTSAFIAIPGTGVRWC